MFRWLNRSIFSFQYWKMGKKVVSTLTERVSPSNELNTDESTAWNNYVLKQVRFWYLNGSYIKKSSDFTLQNFPCIILIAFVPLKLRKPALNTKCSNDLSSSLPMSGCFVLPGLGDCGWTQISPLFHLCLGKNTRRLSLLQFEKGLQIQ